MATAISANVSTNASSTLASLRRSGTTCHPARRSSGVLGANAPRRAAQADLPAQCFGLLHPCDTQAPPRVPRWSADDLRQRGRHEAAAPYPLELRADERPAASRNIPTCPSRSDTSLQLTVTFPECWNGRDLDSRDHMGHLAYTGNGLCPSSHPVAVPSLSLTVRYPVTDRTRIPPCLRGRVLRARRLRQLLEST